MSNNFFGAVCLLICLSCGYSLLDTYVWNYKTDEQIAQQKREYREYWLKWSSREYARSIYRDEVKACEQFIDPDQCIRAINKLEILKRAYNSTKRYMEVHGAPVEDNIDREFWGPLFGLLLFGYFSYVWLKEKLDG